MSGDRYQKLTFDLNSTTTRNMQGRTSRPNLESVKITPYRTGRVFAEFLVALNVAMNAKQELTPMSRAYQLDPSGSVISMSKSLLSVLHSKVIVRGLVQVM